MQGVYYSNNYPTLSKKTFIKIRTNRGYLTFEPIAVCKLKHLNSSIQWLQFDSTAVLFVTAIPSVSACRDPAGTVTIELYRVCIICPVQRITRWVVLEKTEVTLCYCVV